jgi:hypothetical protein
MPPRPEPPVYYPPAPSIPQVGNDQKTVMMFRYATNESIPLRDIAELGAMYNGWRVSAVRVNTRMVDPTVPATVQLVENGIVYANQYAGDGQVVLLPNSLMIDLNTQTLSLDVNGTTYIDSISIELQNVYGSNIYLEWSNAQYVDIDLNVDADSNSYVSLSDLIDLNYFNGRTLERVNVIASIPDQAMPGTVTNVSLLSSSQTLGQTQFVSYDPDQLPIWTDYNRFVVGQNLLDLALYADGAIHMDRVILKIK